MWNAQLTRTECNNQSLYQVYELPLDKSLKNEIPNIKETDFNPYACVCALFKSQTGIILKSFLFYSLYISYLSTNSGSYIHWVLTISRLTVFRLSLLVHSFTKKQYTSTTSQKLQRPQDRQTTVTGSLPCKADGFSSPTYWNQWASCHSPVSCTVAW